MTRFGLRSLTWSGMKAGCGRESRGGAVDHSVTIHDSSPQKETLETRLSHSVMGTLKEAGEVSGWCCSGHAKHY